VLSLRNNVLTNLSSVHKVEGQGLTFSQGDSTVRIPLAFSSLIFTGDLVATQHCQNLRKTTYTKTYAGKYSVTFTGVTLSATVTLERHAGLCVTVQPMNIEVKDIIIDGTANGLPPNLENWWLLLANSKKVYYQLKAMLAEERVRVFGAKWIESVINRELVPYSPAGLPHVSARR